MIIGIHPDRIGDESYSAKWAECLVARGVEVRWLNLLAADALEQARGCDGVMWRFVHSPYEKQSAQRILCVIEDYLGIPVFPDRATRWHYDDKVAQYYLLQALAAPTPQTWLFWEREAAMEWAATAPYPVVFKLATGAAASNVVKVDDRRTAETLIWQMFDRGTFPYTMNEYCHRPALPRRHADLHALAVRLADGLRYAWWKAYPPLPGFWWQPERGYAYFQEFVPGNQGDTRVVVIGTRAFGFFRFNRPRDYRASGSKLFDTRRETVDERCLEIALSLSKIGCFQSMAYDFLIENGQPVITEISYTYTDVVLRDLEGHWLTDLTWVAGRMWPQEAIVDMFVNYVRRRKERLTE